MKTVTLYNADCVKTMKELAANGIQVDAIITDPPYHLQSIVSRFKKTSINDDNKTGKAAKKRANVYARSAVGFMGQEWDGGDVAFRVETWKAAFDILKPGGHLLAFGATRNYHRMAVAIEDAGFEIRDTLAWLYGTGFPKSHDIAKGIDKSKGLKPTVIGKHTTGIKAKPINDIRGGKFVGGKTGTYDASIITGPTSNEAKEWDGWGTALKPGIEPIVLARKPLSEKTIVANVLKHGTGALNIDMSRIALEGKVDPRLGGKGSWKTNKAFKSGHISGLKGEDISSSPLGRWPANVIHDGSEEVISYFPESNSARIGNPNNPKHGKNHKSTSLGWANESESHDYRDSGSAARFFYSAKVSKKERGKDNTHPTVKPVDLMRYLITLITPKNGTILDPFMGSGSTGIAAKISNHDFIGVELSPEYFKIAKSRIAKASEYTTFDKPSKRQAISKSLNSIDEFMV